MSKRVIKNGKPLAMLAVGFMALSFVSVFLSAKNEIEYGAQYSSYKHAWLEVFSVPGVFLITSFTDIPPSNLKIWLECKMEVVIVSGAFYTALCYFPLAGVIRYIR